MAAVHDSHFQHSLDPSQPHDAVLGSGGQCFYAVLQAYLLPFKLRIAQRRGDGAPPVCTFDVHDDEAMAQTNLKVEVGAVSATQWTPLQPSKQKRWS